MSEIEDEGTDSVVGDSFFTLGLAFQHGTSHRLSFNLALDHGSPCKSIVT